MKLLSNTLALGRAVRVPVLSSLVAVLLAFSLVGPGLAATIVNIDVPISGTVFNPCNGENVIFSGIDHMTFRITENGSGGIMLGIHDNIHVTAFGDLGNSYVGNQSDNFILNAHFGVEETSTFSFSEISLGSAPNFVVHEIMHITVNANGTVTAFFDHSTASCQG